VAIDNFPQNIQHGGKHEIDRIELKLEKCIDEKCPKK